MNVIVKESSVEIGKAAAEQAAGIIRNAIATNGQARIVLSTGASQFDFFKAFVKEDIEWSKVTMFHLDEYVNLPKGHIASFRKYLQERFLDLVPALAEVHFVKGDGDVQDNIKKLSAELRKAPIDVALIGIGQNSHIAFNDPPADFTTKEAYIIVRLDDACKAQQVGEGWFANHAEVPSEAITMSVFQILESDVIISVVPSAVKAKAMKLTLENEVTNQIPATILKTHRNWHLYMDSESSALVDPSLFV